MVITSRRSENILCQLLTQGLICLRQSSYDVPSAGESRREVVLALEAPLRPPHLSTFSTTQKQHALTHTDITLAGNQISVIRVRYNNE